MEYVHPEPVFITQQVYDEMIVPWQKFSAAAMDATAQVMRRYLEAFTDAQIISGDCDSARRPV